MSIHPIYYLRCDMCGKECLDVNRSETISSTRKNAKEEEGFAFVKVHNGSYWDMCKECHKQFKEVHRAKYG